MTDYEIVSLIFQAIIINISTLTLITTLLLKIIGEKNAKK